MQYGVSNLLQHIPRNSDKLRERKSMLPKQKSNFPIISTDSGGWGEMGSRCFGLRIADSQKTGLECHIVVTSPSPPPSPLSSPLPSPFSQRIKFTSKFQTPIQSSFYLPFATLLQLHIDVSIPIASLVVRESDICMMLVLKKHVRCKFSKHLITN